MRRSRTIALVSLALLAAAVLLYLLRHSPPRSIAERSPAAGATVQPLPPPGRTPPAPAPAGAPAEVARTDAPSGTFTRRLRCTQGRFFLGRTAPPEVLAALCDRKPLSALKILVPLAEAGDLHGSRCSRSSLRVAPVTP